MNIMKRLVFLALLCLLAFWPVLLVAQDEFKEWGGEDTAAQADGKAPSQAADSPATFSSTPAGGQHPHRNDNLYWLAATVLLTGAAGVLVRFKGGRAARPFFLVASVAVLGFYRGSCPCPVGGLQEAVLFLMGYGGHAGWVWWFVVLLPLTYFFGKIWCGWVCHLGALQELLHRPGRFNFLASASTQRVMRYIRIGVLFALVAQLALTHKVWWKEVDPFKTAFNLMATNPVSWILLGVLLASSVLLYRPFCKTLCPVGLVLGWVSKLPYAAGIGSRPGCIGCKSCSGTCSSHALTWNHKTVRLDQQECIACGECLDACKLQALGLGTGKRAGSTLVLYVGKNKEGAAGNPHSSGAQREHKRYP
jgi:NAD-dependent dihydropyrimidine dehydrogenase PreA subunit